MAWRWPACALAVLALCAVVSATGNYTRPEGTPIGNIIVEPPNPPVCPSGCKGELGPDGPSGRMGRPGARGLPGMPGVPGYDGWSTWAGWKENYRVQAVKGGRGPEGPVGPPGTPGKDGVPGVQGPPGPEGPVGQDGMSGGRGLPGPPGAGGATGPAGPVGPRGPDGAPGSIGGPGVSGPKGDLGDIGRPGAPGNIGFPGSPGEPGLDGAKGSVGDRGPLGYTGEKGFKGSNGDQGVTGNQGAMGERGATGDDGRQGMKGETGDQGLVGDMGAEGAKGESGPYIEKIGVNETNTCGAGNNGKVKFDPYLKKLYFCDGNAWLCVKSQVCDEECQVSQWGDFGACTASCGAGTMTRSRYITSMPGPNNNNRCPELVETVPCRNLPSCFCPEPSPLSNGVRFGNDFRLLSSVQWQCNTGFRLRGPTHSICRVDPDTGSPAFSSMPECLVIGCPRLTAPTNGEVQQGSPPIYNSEAVFSCNAGYRLSNTTNLRCTEAGLWSARPPICVPVMCPDPGTPVNGARNASSNTFAYQTVVGYSCNSGYVLTGSQTIECTSSGAFSGSAPQCIAIDCGRLSAPDNGGIVDSGTDYGSTARYTCDAGYRLVGDVFRLCQSSGSWSGSMPTCQLIDCGDPGNVANGVRSGQSTTYNSVVSFVCNTGYRLFGSDRRVCQENEMWSGSQPTCQIVDCGDPGTPSNGNKQLTVTTYSSIATFSCNQGYDLVGSARRECEANGQWSGTQPICNAIICADPGTPENGGRDGSSLLLGSTVRYFCNPGYQLVGSETRTCQANGRFSGSLPSCQIISCGNPGSPENGNRQGNDFTFTSQVTFTCNTGYVLSGSRMRICLADGTWSGSVARCNLVTCPTPLPPTNGEVNANSVTYSSVASYTCNAGYKLVGAQTRTCQANGDWSLSTPECARITCCSQTAPTNGEMIGSSFDYGSNIGFRCNSGFSLTGSQQRECQGDGTWTGLPPACEPRFCEDPGLIQNGIRTEISLSVGGIAAYQCNAGYRLSGAQSLTCLADGTWSDPLPVCILDVCQDPGVPANGRRIGNSFTVGSSVNYECNDGYVLNGAITLNCQSSATWDLPRPTCDPNCQVGTWTEWSACSVTCLDGIQTRTREVTQPQGGIGAACPALQMTQACRPRDDCGCDGYPVGSIHSQLVQTEQSVGTDVVIVVDESSSMAFYHNWLSSTIKQLDDALLESNIGTDPLVPNRYALVGFGRSALPNGSDILTRPHAFSYEGQKIVHIDQYSSINSQLKEGGNIEDGYLAIDYALKNLTDENGNNLLRINEPGVAINVIFITDEDRDVLTPYGSAITRSGIKRTINRAGALLNVVVDQEFYAGNDRAFGYDSTKTAYIVEPFGEYRNATEGARLGIGYGGTRRDYTNVALELDGAAWDIKILRQAGAVGRSFTNAFLKVKTKEVLRSIDQCRRCSCVDFGRVSRLSCRKAADQPKCKMDAAAGVVETA